MDKDSINKTPLILRFHRLMDAFAKSDDERDFYLERFEGYLIYVDLDKDQSEIALLEEEIKRAQDRFCLIPKMAFYEVKKFMEGFVAEKVYDIDTKEKLLDIIGGKEARENFLEYIYDNLTELEKWQQYYQERFRIRIIEWLRTCNIRFVFEEDLDLNTTIIEKLKQTFFDKKVSKELNTAREILVNKSKSYYSSEALNPRPKRGRPPKQIAKVEIETQVARDIYLSVPKAIRPFLYIPDITSASAVTFSAKFESEEQLLASLKGTPRLQVDAKLEALSQKLESLQQLQNRLTSSGLGIKPEKKAFDTFVKPRISERKKIEIPQKHELKIEEAVQEVLPSTGKEKKLTEPKRRALRIKKVSPIKSSKKKKK